MREIKFHLIFSDHDYQVRIRQAEESLWQGDDVILHLKFRGREMYHQESGLGLLRRMRDDLSQIGAAVAQPQVKRKSVTLTLAPLPFDKRKRKFSKD